VLAGGQPVVQLDALGEDAGSLSDVSAVPLGVHSENADLASRRTSEVQNDVDRRRLAGAVGTKETEHLALFDSKGEIIECDGFDQTTWSGCRL